MCSTLRDGRLQPPLNSILPSSEILRGVRWLKTDVSGLHIVPIFKGQVVHEKGQLDPWRWDRQVVPKRRFQSTLRRVITQQTEECVLHLTLLFKLCIRILYYTFMNCTRNAYLCTAANPTHSIVYSNCRKQNLSPKMTHKYLKVILRFSCQKSETEMTNPEA
jgi:hypothetical protein